MITNTIVGHTIEISDLSEASITELMRARTLINGAIDDYQRNNERRLREAFWNAYRALTEAGLVVYYYKEYGDDEGDWELVPTTIEDFSIDYERG